MVTRGSGISPFDPISIRSSEAMGRFAFRSGFPLRRTRSVCSIFLSVVFDESGKRSWRTSRRVREVGRSTTVLILVCYGSIFMTRALRIAALLFLFSISANGEIASVNGIQLYYEIHGEGSPLLLLHYFGGAGEVWAPFVPEFAKSYRVIVVDMRGHGRSTNPSGQFTHRQSALDIFALLDQLGIK